MTENILNAITVLITQFFLGVYAFLLIDFKKPELKWKTIWIATVVFVLISNIILILTCGYWEVYTKVGIFTVTLPYIFITLWVSKQKGIRVLFSIVTCIFLGCIGNSNAAVAVVLFPAFPLVKPLTRMISFLLLYFFLQLIRRPYLQMLYILKQGWFILCLIPMISCATLIFITNTILRTDPYSSFIVIYGLLTVCSCSYGLIYLFFKKVYHECEAQANSDLLSAQVCALSGRITAVQSVEEKLRIERHDLRHRLQTISTLLEKDDKAAVREYIGVVQDSLNNLQNIRWCSNAVLDAIFTSYFNQAKNSGIDLETILDIPTDLPVDAAELSIVFANALENAIQACMMLPIGQRKIICKCISSPQLMIEISNPYIGSIGMDTKGIPISTKENHGIGTRSIVAFAEKHNAFCDYEAKSGWFSVRISL